MDVLVELIGILDTSGGKRFHGRRQSVHSHWIHRGYNVRWKPIALSTKSGRHLSSNLTIEGEIRELDIVDQDGLALTLNYLVPQRNQCLECHEVKDEDGGRVVVPVGPWVRNLHLEADYGDGMVNQLTYLFEQGMLNDASGLGDVPPAMNFDEVVEGGLEQLDYDTLNTVTRDYLDINCAHCHRHNGVQGITSQLFLNYDNEDEFNLGVCKKPGSAAAGTGGHTYDIVPGSPEESILQFRVETDEVGAMMPLLGRSLVHREGAELTRAWILGMPGEGCEP